MRYMILSPPEIDIHNMVVGNPVRSYWRVMWEGGSEEEAKRKLKEAAPESQLISYKVLS